jgi:ABC-2 type transport system ATP-binding protein
MEHAFSITLMYILELERVRKIYDLQIAVNDISFKVPKGSIFGLLGPNGAGKTSTIRMITGITLPDAGAIQLFGEPQRAEHQDMIGYMPEERGLYKKMKVRDQLEYLGALKGLNKHDLKRSIDHWLDRLELRTSEKKKTNELSKGMHQKLQFIATVLHDPDLLILDEPLSGLDPVNAQIINDVILEFQKAGKTIILSTHRMEQVEQLCDEIVLMHRASIVLAGTLRELKSKSGRRLINIGFYGDDSFADSFPAGVQTLSRTRNEVLIELNDMVKPNDILRAASERAEIRKWEMVEPPLKELFLDAVKSRGEKVVDLV